MTAIAGTLFHNSYDDAVLGLVQRGHATGDELFEAQFWRWPINGLDKDRACDETLYFKTFEDDKKATWKERWIKSFTDYAYVRSDEPDEHNIYLNADLLKPEVSAIIGALFASRLASARLWDLTKLTESIVPFSILFGAVQLYSGYRFAMASTLVKLVKPSVSKIVGEEQIHTYQKKNPSILQSAFQNHALDHFRNQPWYQRYPVNVQRGIDSFLTMMPRVIHTLDAEMETKLYLMVMHGVRKWGEIPRNRDDLYYALMDVGAITPAMVKQYYRGYEGISPQFNRHSWWTGYINPESAEMNIGLNSFRSAEIMEMFWRDAFPYFYGNILTYMGDSRGLEKMGFSSQEKDLLGMPMLSSL